MCSRVQDEIAQSVVEKLKVKLLGAADTPLVTRPMDNVEAYNLVLQGRYHHMRATGAALEKSLECFAQALALEPTYAKRTPVSPKSRARGRRSV